MAEWVKVLSSGSEGCRFKLQWAFGLDQGYDLVTAAFESQMSNGIIEIR